MKTPMLALALILFGTGAEAQVPNFPQTVPSNTVIGRLSPNSGPTEAIPIARLFNTILQTPIRQLTINTLGGTAPGMTITHGAMAGTCTSIVGCSFNLINIQSDVAAMPPGTFGVGLNIFHQFGGSAMTGGREAIQAIANLAAPTNASNDNRNYVGAGLFGTASSGDGGTNTGAGALGAVFGFNAFAKAVGGATNLLNLSAGEINIAAQVGSTVKHKTGIQIVGHSSDAVSGVTTDAGLSISGQGGIGFNDGILFSDFTGGFGVKSTGTLIRMTGGGYASGIDFSAGTFSNAIISGPGGTFFVNGAGTAMQVPLIGGGSATNASLTLQGSDATCAGACTDFIYFKTNNILVGSVGTGHSGAHNANWTIGTAPPSSNSQFWINGHANAASVAVAPVGTDLHISGADGNPSSIILYDGYGGATRAQYRRANGTAAAPTGLVANDVVGNVAALGMMDNGAYTTAGSGLIQFIATETWTPTANGMAVNIRSLKNGTSSSIASGNNLLWNGFGHLAPGTDPPTSVSSCGTGTITTNSTDTQGHITATGATACTVNFGASFAAAPTCVVSDNTTAAALKVTTAVGSFTVTGLTSSDEFSYICLAKAGG